MNRLKLRSISAQTAMEYLLILTVVGVIVLASMKFLLPRANHSSEGYFNSVTRVILGEKPDPIDGHWCAVECPVGGANPIMHRTCECPAPAFGGRYCTESDGGTDVVHCSVGSNVTPCVSNGSCSAAVPACGQITFGEDNCHQACTRQGPVCPHT